MSDDSRTLMGIILVAIGLILFFVEIFVPSGGLLAVLAAAGVIGGVVVLFYVNTTFGLIGLICALVAIPFLLILGLKIMPNTFVARLLTLKNPTPVDNQSGSGAANQALLGAAGKALTDLRPVGTCLINGRRTECIAERGMVDAGQPVRVVHADGMQIKVRVDEQA